MKRINENQKVTLTLGQLKRLVNESDENNSNVDVLSDVSLLWNFYNTKKHFDAGWDLIKILEDTLRETYSEPLKKFGKFLFWLRSKGIDKDNYEDLASSTLYAFVYEKDDILYDLIRKAVWYCEDDDATEGKGLRYMLEYFDSMFEHTFKQNVENDIGDAQAFDEFNEFRK